MTTCCISGEQFEEVVNDLISFVHRVSRDKKATPAEIAALPEIAKVLLLLSSD